MNPVENNNEQIDSSIGLITNTRFPRYFSYEDLINWCESKKDIVLSNSDMYGGQYIMPYEIMPNKNALIQFMIDFGIFFDNKYIKMYEDKCGELEELKKKQNEEKRLPIIKW